MYERNIAKEKGSSSLFPWSLINIKTRIIDIKLKMGIETNGKNQRKLASNDPRIGLSTLPIVFEVSIKPNVLLASASRSNISPMRGKTIGIAPEAPIPDRKSTRLNSSHVAISYAVFCLKKKKKE